MDSISYELMLSMAGFPMIPVRMENTRYWGLVSRNCKGSNTPSERIIHALRLSQENWHQGQENPVTFIKYILGTILSAYKDFEDRFSIVEEKLSAIEMVRKAAGMKIGRFSKRDVMELCPSLSISSVEGSLRKLVASGELKREGQGKSISYIRLS